MMRPHELTGGGAPRCRAASIKRHYPRSRDCRQRASESSRRRLREHLGLVPPDWPNFRRPMHKDPWFLVSVGLGLCIAIRLLVIGQYLPAILAPIVVPLMGGDSRRLIVGTNERDKAHRIRERMEAATPRA